MTGRITPQAALQLAVDALASQAAMARLCGVSQPTVFKWLRRNKPLPAEHVLKVEAATGISRHDLRPDIYPRDAASSTASGHGAAAGGAGGSTTPSRAEPADAPDPGPLSGLTV